jgi:hypothetical protein
MLIGVGRVNSYPALMSQADRLKEEIGWLKVLSGVLAALDASLIAWLVQNYEAASWMLTSATGASIILLSAGIAATVVRLYRFFKILEAV